MAKKYSEQKFFCRTEERSNFSVAILLQTERRRLFSSREFFFVCARQAMSRIPRSQPVRSVSGQASEKEQVRQRIQRELSSLSWYLEQIEKKNTDTLCADPVSISTSQPRPVHQMQLMNETDLHYRVVRYIRRFHPEAVLVAGLGELQETEAKRLDAWAKGYFKGQPDLLILNRHRRHSGLALELKTPAVPIPQASQQQVQALEKLQKLGFQTLVSNDYDVICRALDAYMALQVFHCT